MAVIILIFLLVVSGIGKLLPADTLAFPSFTEGDSEEIDRPISEDSSRVTMPVALILVDFPDGRLRDGSAPVRDSDTAYFTPASINAVGSFGWIFDSSSSPPILKKKIRKYRYEDYWNKIFSYGMYHDDSAANAHPHPDYASHGISVYGSMADYYKEVSYGRFLIEAAVTHRGSKDMYHTGIVNRIDTAYGKKYVRWITMPKVKSSYGKADWSFVLDAIDAVQRCHALGPADPDYIEFDPASFRGKIIISGAGSNIGGFSRINSQYSTVSEKAYYTPNSDPKSHFDGILQSVHEFGHALGLPHVALGSFDPMHWGGMAPILEYCPPHFNPVTKFNLGWLPRHNIVEVDSDRTVVLQPSHLPLSDSCATAAFVRLTTSSRGSSDYSRGEYLVVEYRTRDGFNRYSGGKDTRNFSGGALVWHYSPLASFPYLTSTDDIAGYLSLDIPGYSASYPHAKDQSSADYLAAGAVLDSASILPNTRTVRGVNTGWILDSFRVKNGKLSFNARRRFGPVMREESLRH